MANGPDLRSRIVVILKVCLPLVAVGMLAALFLIQTDDSLGGGEIVFSEADLKALGSGLRVTHPILTGATEGNDRFRFTADLVEPDAAPPTHATITTLGGELALYRGLTLELSATTGTLDLKTQNLALGGMVRIISSDGYEMRSDTMSLDLGAGVLEAAGTVETDGPLGRIDSGSLRIAPTGPDRSNTAHLISFGNGVRLRYDPPATPPAKGP